MDINVGRLRNGYYFVEVLRALHRRGAVEILAEVAVVQNGAGRRATGGLSSAVYDENVLSATTALYFVRWSNRALQPTVKVLICTALTVEPGDEFGSVLPVG